MNRKRLRIDWILTLLAGAAAATEAAQPLDAVTRAAEQFILAQVPEGKGRVHVSAEPLDPRLRLARCGQALTTQRPQAANFGARVSVGVSCVSPRWTVYVSVRVESELPVLVLRNALPRNAAIGAADVEMRTQRVPGLASSYIGSLEELAGRHLKRPVPAGTALTADLLVADVLVRRGQRVTLVASIDGLEVRAPGEAIQDATAAGRVRVLNLSSRKVVEGQVESRDVVRVSL
jgi:flagella basal body P-ring formation protein FlgA